MVYYSLTSDVRELARSVLPADFSDAEIQKEQYMAQSKIWAVTKKADWDAADPAYEFIKKMEIKQAAIYILEHYEAVEIIPLLNSWQLEVDTGLKAVADSVSDPSMDEPIKVIASNYESYPNSLNDNADSTPYRSTAINI
jgi:hypothetical protein